jgi:hypothetical protein
MNLQQPNAHDATRSVNRSKSVVPQSDYAHAASRMHRQLRGIKATFRSRELIYPGPFGDITAGGDIRLYPLIILT